MVLPELELMYLFSIAWAEFVPTILSAFSTHAHLFLCSIVMLHFWPVNGEWKNMFWRKKYVPGVEFVSSCTLPFLFILSLPCIILKSIKNLPSRVTSTACPTFGKPFYLPLDLFHFTTFFCEEGSLKMLMTTRCQDTPCI